MPSSVRAAYTAVSSPTPISSPRKTAPIGPASNHSAPPASQDPRPPDTGTSRIVVDECSRHEQRALAAARLERSPRGGQGRDEEQAEQRCADGHEQRGDQPLRPRDRRFPSSRGGDPRRAWRPCRPGRAQPRAGRRGDATRSAIRRAPSDPTAARAAPAATRIAASITIPASWSTARVDDEQVRDQHQADDDYQRREGRSPHPRASPREEFAEVDDSGQGEDRPEHDDGAPPGR